MATVGELAEFLSCFDPSLPLQILAADGCAASELIDLAAMDVLGPAVARTAGDPAVIWLVARRRDDVSLEALPECVVLARNECGCLLAVPVALDRPIATWAIECEHSTSVQSRR